jgi:hypothetical protein
MTNLGTGIPLMCTDASMQVERLQDGLAEAAPAEAAPVAKNGQEKNEVAWIFDRCRSR